MDTKDLTNLLNKSKEQLNQILDQCKDGPTELALLASKMYPLLDDFSANEEELLASTTAENGTDANPTTPTAT